MLASTCMAVKNVKQRFKRQKSKHERQKDLDGCHEIVKVGESTAISATCDAVLNVFINSEFTLFPTCVRAWILIVHLLSSFHVADVDPHVLARRSQEGSVVAETDRSNLNKNI